VALCTESAGPTEGRRSQFRMVCPLVYTPVHPALDIEVFSDFISQLPGPIRFNTMIKNR